MVRSSKASSAARRAASSMKSVRFLPSVLAARSISPRSSGLMRRLRERRLRAWVIFYSSQNTLSQCNDLVFTKLTRGLKVPAIETFGRRAARHVFDAASRTPMTQGGKQQSRRNAMRHGLTAATVVTAIEDSQEFERFEAAIRADYQPVSAIDHELVARLASLLWRLRRAALIETNLFQLQGRLVM